MNSSLIVALTAALILSIPGRAPAQETGSDAWGRTPTEARTTEADPHRHVTTWLNYTPVMGPFALRLEILPIRFVSVEVGAEIDTIRRVDVKPASVDSSHVNYVMAPQGAAMLRGRLPVDRHWSIGMGVGAAVGEYSDSGYYLVAERTGYWETAWRGRAEFFGEVSSGRWVGRFGLGWEQVLSGEPDASCESDVGSTAGTNPCSYGAARYDDPGGLPDGGDIYLSAGIGIRF